MQISANNNLPVISGIRQEPLNRKTLAQPSRQQTDSETPPDRLNGQLQYQTQRRPPLFLQTLSDANLSRKGQQAMQTYHDVAMAGSREELVNRVNEMA